MNKILEGPSRRVGTIFQQIDINFIEVCNNILHIAFPDHNLLGYADIEPVAPTLNDSYLVTEDATLWTVPVTKNDILFWNGASWEILPFKITQLNAALQYLYFDADKIAITAIPGLAATDAQAALEEIAAVLVANAILTVAPGSGSI